MKKSWIKTEILLSIVVPMVFWVIAFFARIYFGENAYPVDYDIIDSYDWANIFFSWFTLFAIICIISNVFIAVMGEILHWNSQKAWIVYGIIAIVISIIAPICITFRWREESGCTALMYLLFILEYVVTFLLSTWKAPKHWDFCPF